ncbi:MAG: LCP family protein [Clostridiales bacterium]|nr:LCP family protein [Clostridiales bacterium]
MKDNVDDSMIKDVSENIVKNLDESIAQEDQMIILEEETNIDDNTEESLTDEAGKGNGKKRSKKILIAIGSILAVFILIVAYFVGTRPGRKALYGMCSVVLTSRLDVVEAEQNEENILFTEPVVEVNTKGEEESSPYRKEEYVANILLVGIEEIKGGARSDSMMIASINIKDKSIKLTSLMRDCYVEIEGHGKNKLNAAYSFGGTDLLMRTIQDNFKIHLDGYAVVNFASFEKIVDMLDGVDIELGRTEANYLNNNNYISNPANRNVKPGWNKLNGNQALGYARVRYCATLGGAKDDYGRTLRQRRLLNAIFDKYKSKSFLELVSIMYDILPEIKTNLTTSQISDIIEQVVENSITTIDNYRIPADGCFQNVNNECGDVLVLDFDANIKELYKNIYLDETQIIVEK